MSPCPYAVSVSIHLGGHQDENVKVPLNSVDYSLCARQVSNIRSQLAGSLDGHMMH